MRLRDRLSLIVVVLESLVLACQAHGAITYTDLYTAGRPAGLTYATPQNRSAGGGQLAGVGGADSGTVAVLWSSQNKNGLSLHPVRTANSRALYTSGSQQVGVVDFLAALWSSTAASYVNLNPTGAGASEAVGTDGTQQVGNAFVGTGYHAFVWNGTAASGVNLTPGSTYSAAYALGVGGGQQVGYGLRGAQRALVWNGTAESVVELDGGRFISSTATGTDGASQVGSSVLPGGSAANSHAMLWKGTAASAVDLHPSEYAYTQATAVDGEYQVGFGRRTDGPVAATHALFWTGSSDSVISLGDLLPSNFVSSYASSIRGNTIYGVAQDTANRIHAIAWTIPEPALMLTSAVLCGILLRRQRSGT